MGCALSLGFIQVQLRNQCQPAGMYVCLSLVLSAPPLATIPGPSSRPIYLTTRLPAAPPTQIPSPSSLNRQSMPPSSASR